MNGGMLRLCFPSLQRCRLITDKQLYRGTKKITKDVRSLQMTQSVMTLSLNSSFYKKYENFFKLLHQIQ